MRNSIVNRFYHMLIRRVCILLSILLFNLLDANADQARCEKSLPEEICTSIQVPVAKPWDVEVDGPVPVVDKIPLDTHGYVFIHHAVPCDPTPNESLLNQVTTQPFGTPPVNTSPSISRPDGSSISGKVIITGINKETKTCYYVIRYSRSAYDGSSGGDTGGTGSTFSSSALGLNVEKACKELKDNKSSTDAANNFNARADILCKDRKLIMCEQKKQALGACSYLPSGSACNPDELKSAPCSHRETGQGYWEVCIKVNIKCKWNGSAVDNRECFNTMDSYTGSNSDQNVNTESETLSNSSESSEFLNNF